MAAFEAAAGHLTEMDVVFEVGGLDRLGELLRPYRSQRVLILSSPSRRFVDRAIAALPALEVAVFDGARVHVPVGTVASAQAAMDAHRADTVVAVGGGAPVGLGKALCLRRDLTLVAVATTYSGSEMTSVYGTTEDGMKRTGRDERVRPALVLYDAKLTTELPVLLTVQSLTNSLAQIVSALSTDSLPDPEAIMPTVAELWRLMSLLREHPRDVALRERALRASSKAGTVVETGTMGHQHKLAHRLGGRFDLPHSTVHSVLLIAFMAWLRRERPQLMERIDHAAGTERLETRLREVLRDSGGPVSLQELGVTAAALDEVLAAHSELLAEVALAAHRGQHI